MSEVTVSVIIPVFNAAEYLIDTLNSVCNQTYQNIEVIIVDDGSTDASLELAKRYDDDRFIIAKNKGKGACAARNYGFELSTGDYIQYLDADDLLSVDKIKKQVEILNEYENDIIVSAVWGKFISSKTKVIWENHLLNKNFDPAYKWLSDSWKGNGVGQTAIWLTPRKLIEKAGPWNENLKINQDGEFFSRVLMNAKAVQFCEGAKVYYRSGNANSISQKNKFSKEKAESLLLSFQLYKSHAVSLGLLDKLKEGIAQNFLMFMYQFYNQFKDLVAIAESEFYSLGYKKMWPVGGEKFKKISSVIGFKTALKTRDLLSK